MHAKRILYDFFDANVHIDCQEITRSYIISTLSNVDGSWVDLSKDSIVLTYSNASDFKTFQGIGDWVLWSGVFCPELLSNHKVVYENFGRLSYDRCYLMMRGQWKLYEELADTLPKIISKIRDGISIKL